MPNMKQFKSYDQCYFFSLKWVIGQGQGQRSNLFCMSGKPLSQGIYMPNIKALTQTVQKL